jgi:RHS repeat-associated protein
VEGPTCLVGSQEKVNGAFYNYYYDGLGRRRQKSYPGGTSDEFFYTGANQLLVDRGSSGVVTPVAHYTQEDYVWLGGRPVALVRGKLSNTWTKLADTSADCARNGEAAACGVYFPVTDDLGKPVLMLDANGHVAGAVDYEPFGHVNRVGLVAETEHPLDNNSASSQTLGAMEQPTGTSPLANHATSVRMRALFHQVDLTAGQVDVVDADLGTVLASVSGTGRGRTWSDWVTPSTGRASVRLAWPGGQANTTSQGVVLEGYEYQRHQTGAQPFWTPLRFPGQYHDAETDLFENWNRYYDPSIGWYLQPEPMVVEPQFVKGRALDGFGTPTYAYASNNPVTRYDPTGLYDVDPRCSNVPNEQDVRAGAASITDECLRTCVLRKINEVNINCGWRDQIECKKDPDLIGYAPRGGQCQVVRAWELWKDDNKDMGWCSRKLSSTCQMNGMVHEIAHLCGWKDGEMGKGVPYDSGVAPSECLTK